MIAIKKLSSLLNVVLCCAVLLSTGCGRKSDPVIPPVPYPLPAQNASANIVDDSIRLSWTLPAGYDTGKPLKLEDIRQISVFRKTVPSTINLWDFEQVDEGWTVAGKTLPIKWHKGVLRTASKQTTVFIVSPKNLSLNAKNSRYIRLKLWSRNSDRGYIAFITKNDTKWDTNIDLTFQPVVHTSFYAFYNVFNSLKLKSFQIEPVNDEEKTGNFASEYIIDMGKVLSWKGTITQIGILLRNNDPENATAELGLDSLEFTNTLEKKPTIYESSPWLFLADEEGWRTNRPDTVFGAAGGVLYAKGTEPVVLLSSPDQNIKRDTIRQIQVRMKVTHGDTAYFVLRRPQDKQQPFTETSPPTSANIFQVSLNDTTNFHTYTINLPDISPENDVHEPPENDAHEPMEREEIISQIGLLFPALTDTTNRHILIDYVHILEKDAEPGLLLPYLIQKDPPPILEIEQQVRKKMRANNPEFSVLYTALPSKKKQTNDGPITLVETSSKDPAPVVIEDETFSLIDTGQFSVDDKLDTALEYGKRYTYTIELIDRKKRKNTTSSSITVEFTQPPMAPHNFRAEAGDEEIRLLWDRPFLTLNKNKIASFKGYTIFRSLEPGKYSNTPIYEASQDETTFLDQNLSNGTTYYYTIQSVGATAPDSRGKDFTSEVSATPVNNIPPDTPTGLVGIYTENSIKMFWNAVQAKDFSGFHVYRSEDPEGEFHRINPQPILQASYQDTTVEPRKSYSYYVTSFDNAVPPNESQPSKTIAVETFTFDFE